MKISEVQEQLWKLKEEYGDVEVMFSDPNRDVYGVSFIEFRVAEEDEFDESWGMPEGFKFVNLCNY